MWKKAEELLCPEVRYRRTGKGIFITGCYGMDGELVLPDAIGKEPVTGIDAYAFARKEEDDGEEVWLSPYAGNQEERHRICGPEVTSVWLPADTEEIGRYAFYRCRNLKKLTLSDRLLELGGGALTGCRLPQVELYFFQGRRSCLKSILDEIRYQVRAELWYEDSKERVRILFPEHYEEAVENTPARLLVTHHHGSGGYYRQCFYDRELDYKKYDETFFRARAEEEPEIAAELALNRLRYPHGLSGEAEEAYESYLKDHLAEAFGTLISDEDLEGVRFLLQKDYWNKEKLEQMIEMAAGFRKTEILSLLMDERRRRFPAVRKKFEL